MPRAILYLLELIGVGGIVGLMAYIPWTKMALGGALAFLGAFFPSMKDARQSQSGDGQLTWQKIVIKFSGGIRFAVVMGGIVLLVGAILEGHEGFTKMKELREKAMADARAEYLQQALKRLEGRKKAHIQSGAASEPASTRTVLDQDLADFLLEELAKQKKPAQ